MNINFNQQNVKTTSATFKAIKVKKREVVLMRENVTFYNNATAMLNKPCKLFEGVIYLIKAIESNLAEKVLSCLDENDLRKIHLMLKSLPKELFADRKLYGAIGSGISNLALKLDKGEVLCLSENLDTFEERKFEDFDLPLKAKSAYSDDNKKKGWFIRDFGKPVSKNELYKLEDYIISKGYWLSDWRTEQACKLNGKLYLIDFECAQRLPKE